MIGPALLGIISSEASGGAGPLRPPVSDDLALWLDASQLPYSSTTNLTSWPDLSDAGTPTTCHSNPQFQTNPINGKKGVFFASPNWLEINLDGVDTDTEGTLLMVAKTTSTGRTQNVGFAGNAPSPDDSWLTYDGTLYDCQLVGVRGSVSLGSSDQSNPYVYGVFVSSAGRVVRFRGSNVISDAQTFKNPVGLAGYQRLGGTNVNVAGADYNQVIAEVLYYRRRLDSTEIATMESYLNSKWSIT